MDGKREGNTMMGTNKTGRERSKEERKRGRDGGKGSGGRRR